eukprot:TRINITY_DN467_c0_g1_i12.p1 TRINITY_DN467_c0_g1~~TRINITY_DN467_c0_g1_i12.p1  ORF type:complete len:389 (+),score=82.02 TRINITY_DN467_c0_g1_i12:838-2004(+)
MITRVSRTHSHSHTRHLPITRALSITSHDSNDSNPSLSTSSSSSNVRVFSGIQPTGHMHLGNYLGALKSWKSLQDEYGSEGTREDLLFCVVDLHAITSPKKLNPDDILENSMMVTAAMFACGLSTEKCVVYRQSDVPAHAQLAWVLNCVTPMSWLHRMTQFKSKAKETKHASLGLFAYPVLQAADVLLFQSTHVPVGEDQLQHIELARDIAKSFNAKAEQVTDNPFRFTLPKTITNENARVMSLRDATVKMGKSNPQDSYRINLNDSADVIAQKIRKAKTDALPIEAHNLDQRPEISNLVSIYASLSGLTDQQVCHKYKDAQTSQFKEGLTQLLIDTLLPISTQMDSLLKDDRVFLKQVLDDGRQIANNLAHPTITNVNQVVFGNHRT